MSDGPISLLVSDVDGTLVTHDKRLTEAAIAAARRLASVGVRLSLVSSRPPSSFAPLAGLLGLDAPIGAFNGGAILNPDMSVIEATFLPPEAARIALDAFREFGLDAWLDTIDTWYVLDVDGPYVAKERHTIATDPVLVPSFESVLDKAGKLVGSSEDFAKVAACEAALQARLGTSASAKRSQNYYLDVTPHGFDKGEAVRRIARILDVPISEVAVIGDMANDLPMFGVAGTKIAMGNAIEELKRIADFVTTDNEHDGFANAVERFILSRAKGRS